MIYCPFMKLISPVCTSHIIPGNCGRGGHLLSVLSAASTEDGFNIDSCLIYSLNHDLTLCVPLPYIAAFGCRNPCGTRHRFPLIVQFLPHLRILSLFKTRFTFYFAVVTLQTRSVPTQENRSRTRPSSSLSLPHHSV